MRSLKPSRRRLITIPAGYALLFFASPALATSPFSLLASEIWIRSQEGEIIYAKARNERLASLCVDVGAGGNWISSSVLTEIALPKLETLKVIHGVGMSHTEKYIPDWGDWGLSLVVETSVEDANGNHRDGPTYLFVMDKKRVTHRVRWEWVASTDGKPEMVQEEKWLPLGPDIVSSAPCSLPMP